MLERSRDQNYIIFHMKRLNGQNRVLAIKNMYRVGLACCYTKEIEDSFTIMSSVLSYAIYHIILVSVLTMVLFINYQHDLPRNFKLVHAQLLNMNMITTIEDMNSFFFYIHTRI